MARFHFHKNAVASQMGVDVKGKISETKPINWHDIPEFLHVDEDSSIKEFQEKTKRINKLKWEKYQLIGAITKFLPAYVSATVDLEGFWVFVITPDGARPSWFIPNQYKSYFDHLDITIDEEGEKDHDRKYKDIRLIKIIKPWADIRDKIMRRFLNNTQ